MNTQQFVVGQQVWFYVDGRLTRGSIVAAHNNGCGFWSYDIQIDDAYHFGRLTRGHRENNIFSEDPTPKQETAKLEDEVRTLKLDLFASEEQVKYYKASYDSISEQLKKTTAELNALKNRVVPKRSDVKIGDRFISLNGHGQEYQLISVNNYVALINVKTGFATNGFVSVANLNEITLGEWKRISAGFSNLIRRVK